MSTSSQPGKFLSLRNDDPWPKKKYSIFTAADSGAGDFLVQHWLPSLKTNVNLEQIDVWVLDYGLSDTQLAELMKHSDVRRSKCKSNGFVGTLRFLAIAEKLKTTRYKEILLCDCSDLIFQTDISHLFEKGTDTFRCVAEQTESSLHQLVMDPGDFEPDEFRRILCELEGCRTLNCGFLLGPSDKFEKFGDFIKRSCRSTRCYASDQLLFNQFAYRHGFESLNPRYNFVLVTSQDRYRIQNSAFYDSTGELIPVVHNAGGKDAYRVISRFGFGPGHNRRKRLTSIGLKILFALFSIYRKSLRISKPLHPRRKQDLQHKAAA